MINRKFEVRLLFAALAAIMILLTLSTDTFVGEYYSLNEHVSTGTSANVTLAMNRTKAASVIVEVDATVATSLIETMVEVDVEGASEVVEEAAALSLEETVSILEGMSVESLKKLLIEIARLPHTPETAAELLEAMSLEKAVEVVRFIIEYGALEDLGEIFHHLSAERLNDIFEALTVNERYLLLPYLSVETLERIPQQLLPLPDLTPISIDAIPPEAVAEESCTVDVTVRNIGRVEAGRFNVELEADEVAVGKTSVEGLTAGFSTTLTFTWKPEEAGDYMLKATVDPEDVVTELDETNNTATVAVTVAIPPPPFPPPVYIGGAVTIFASIIGAILLRRRRRR